MRFQIWLVTALFFIAPLAGASLSLEYTCSGTQRFKGVKQSAFISDSEASGVDLLSLSDLRISLLLDVQDSKDPYVSITAYENGEYHFAKGPARSAVIYGESKGGAESTVVCVPVPRRQSQ